MLLNNYWKAFAITHQAKGTGTMITIENKETMVYSSTSYKNLLLGDMMNKVVTSYNPGSSSAAIILGDGDVPVTKDDYKLSGEIITGIVASVTNNSGVDEDGATASALCTITNNNEQSIIIKEIGLVTYYSKQCLVERTVLESPVTIEPGGVGQVTYTIRMNSPTA